MYNSCVLVELLESYHQFEIVQLTKLKTKAGLRFDSDRAAQLDLFSSVQVPKSGFCLDATGTAGILCALLGIEQGVILDTSFAALRVARENTKDKPGLELLASALWTVPNETFNYAYALLSTDKGNTRVEAEIKGLAKVLKPQAKAYLMSHKDQGAKRYEKQLRDYFASVKVIGKSKGWRLVEVEGQKGHDVRHESLSFKVCELCLAAEPGVYAAGKLDPGTEFLLTSYHLEDLAAKKVLDLGCGYGLIALKAALAGADVTALDDDLLAIQSAYQNAKTYGLDIRFLHSDINSELRKEEKFDLVLSNPPFHVGKQVKLELPHAFIAAAFAHLKPGGEFVMVANKALSYEPLLSEFSFWDKLAENTRFKVLRAIK